MQHVEFGWKTTNGVDIYAQGWQPDGNAPVKAVVLIIHGLGEHSSRYEHVAAFFAKQGIATLSNDRVGHGKSGGKRGHVAKYAYLLDDIDQLQKEAAARYPGAPVFLYGHSMGGAIVLNYLLQHPKNSFKGVIATGPALRPAFQPSRFVVALGKVMRGIFPGFVQNNQLDITKISRDKAVVKNYQEDPLNHSRLSAEMGIGLLEWGQKALDTVGTIQTPLLLLHGGADGLTSPQATQEFAKKAKGDVTLKIWDGLYHEIHNEPEKADVLQGMYEWMQSKL